MSLNALRKEIKGLEETGMSCGKKPKLHSSMLSMMLKCGISFEFRYVKGIILPPGIALLLGSATHNVQEYELIYKIENDGKPISLEEAEDCGRDSFRKQVEKNGVQLTPEERIYGVDEVLGNAADAAVVLAKMYHNNLSPIINPTSVDHVEWPWVVEFEGYPFDLAGTTDVLLDIGFRDLKTAKQTPTQASIDSSDQYTQYDLAFRTIKGKAPKIFQDTLVKTKTPKVKSFESSRSQLQIERFVNRLEAFANAYEKGVFLPASNQGWWCSPLYCGYAKICKYYLGVKQFSVA